MGNMRPLVVLCVALAVMGAGCISVEVIKKEQPASDAALQSATTTEQTVTSSTGPLALPLITSSSYAIMEAATSSDTRFVEDALQLQATVEADGVKLGWSPMAEGQVQGYKVVRSASDTLPWYPKSGAIAFVVDGTSYLDRGAETGTAYYYRICAVVTDAPVACGNVVKIGRL